MKSLNYQDSNGKYYQLGDIVFNPCFRDYWLVGKYSDNPDIAKYEEECPYYLAQYGDPDLYFMDLDEPTGFIIEERKGTDRYEEAIKELNEIAKTLKEFHNKGDEEENEQLDNSSKE